jgi:hypothetical protein
MTHAAWLPNFKFLIHQETLNIFGYQTTFGDQNMLFTFTTESVA